MLLPLLERRTEVDESPRLKLSDAQTESQRRGAEGVFMWVDTHLDKHTSLQRQEPTRELIASLGILEWWGVTREFTCLTKDK